MSHRPLSTPALIVHFLSYVRSATIRMLGRYLAKAWQILRSTTRTIVSRLYRAGTLVRVGRGAYALASQEAL